MFEGFDGSNRKPRQVQVDALKWLSDNWNDYKFFAIQAPTGSGKSAISKAIMNEIGSAAYLAPNNVLIEQMVSAYLGLNSLIGAEHYRCKEDESVSCRERAKMVKHYCGDCEYRSAINRATEGEATAFNPMSYYYMRRREGWVKPKVIVIDEAHSFPECLKLLVSFELNYEKYKWPETTNAVDLIKWAEGWLKSCEKVLAVSDVKRYSGVLRSYDHMHRLHNTLSKYQHEVSIYHKTNDKNERVLVLEPLNIPTRFMADFLDVDKAVILSATLTHYSIEQIVGDSKFAYLELDSPIECDNRPVYHRPAAMTMSAETPINYLAALIKSIRKEFPGNCICHVTYAWAQALRPYFPDALIHTKTTKKSTLRKFKAEGGLWIAAGCDEGIDLPDDVCRTNIILRLPRPNVGALSVAKRRALEGGQEWYDIQTLVKTIQQAGRSTRHEGDKSSIIICDPGFQYLIEKYKDQIPKSFLESIHWRKNDRRKK